MPSTAGMGFLAGGETTRIHVRHRFLPIVVLPGIMGSRLSDPKTGKLAWNPKGKPLGEGPKGFKVDYDRLSQPIPLVPDEKNGFKDAAKKAEVKHIRHYYNLIGDYYGELAKELAALEGNSFEQFGVKPRVYCCGYDWRQDNSVSAMRLAEVVEEALAETREKKVIIVAHSMGGLVTRYFCHALGGEKRVHAVILMGSPTLGAPTAYVQVKNGLHGSYPTELQDAIADGDAGAIVEQSVHQAANIVGGVSDIITRGDMMELFDVCYVAMCLGAGTWLTRDETRYFARQLTSMYQLMPNGAYCEKNHNWVLFDPMATGHPPTGKMLVLPTLLDAAVGVVGDFMGLLGGKAAEAGEDLKDEYGKALKPGAALRTSKRAKRNRVTLDELLDEIAEKAKKIDEEPMGLHEIYEKIRKLYDRAEKSFLHCAPHEYFYRDIYTGLLDVVEQRALCAVNVELMLRFDAAMTTRGADKKATGKGLMKAMIKPLLSLLGVSDGHGGGDGHGGHDDDGRKVYMHPNTVNIFCETEQVEAGCGLIPTEVLSNDDSNEVHFEVFPIPIGVQGDGTVPAASANPPAEQLSHDFVHRESVPRVAHGAMGHDAGIIAFVGRRIDAMIEDWVHDRMPEREEEEQDEPEEGSGSETGDDGEEAPAMPTVPGGGGP